VFISLFNTLGIISEFIKLKQMAGWMMLLR